MLTIGVYFLTQHPDVLRRLRQEILDVVGPTKQPTYDDIRGMKYLRAVINGMSSRDAFRYQSHRV